MTSLAHELAACLAANGVEVVFGIPGVHTIELYRGLDGSGLRHITPRHEQGAGFMADAYARVSGKPGVCYLITGPGLTNAVTAIAQAYSDSIPMLVISTVGRMGDIGSGRGHLHELPDQGQLMAQVTAFSRTILTPCDLHAALAEAFSLFAGARPRPVHIEIPVDLLLRDTGRPGPLRPFTLPARPAAPPWAIARAADLCAVAARPVIVAGGGALRAGDAIRGLAERLDAPVLMTANARGLLAPDHPLGLSVAACLPPVTDLLAAADLILAIGTELGPTDFDRSLDGPDAPKAPVIRIDIDPLQGQRGLAPALLLLADAESAAGDLLQALPAAPRSGAAARRVAQIRGRVSDALTPVQRAGCALLDQLARHAPDGIFIGDSAQPVYAGLTVFAPPRTGAFFSSATGYGTLGYGLPAAIGAWIAAPDRPVFCLIGDGGLQFSLPEMGSATEIGAAITMILWNNHGYGEIRNVMVGAGIAPLGVDIHSPDFAALAKGYGWQHIRISDLADLDRCLAETGPLPRVIEIDEMGMISATLS
ncbi:MAG: 5-guanidino-2-oxopentanoate decarboxylase [Rhodobacteraceae bacterium]|nr:5-guanidino-2-oxopentanoate decarboxylase [Paracoccaceae bacterium]